MNNRTFKAFKLRVEHVSRRLSIPMNEIMKWTLRDFYKALSLL